MRNLLAALLVVGAAFAVLPVSSSFADGFDAAGWCIPSDNARQHGDGNSVDVDGQGCGYTSVDQDGDDNEALLANEGFGNAQILGQYADGTRAESYVDGNGNATGTVLTADGAFAETKIDGDGNNAGIYSEREGSSASIRIRGDGNSVMVTQR